MTQRENLLSLLRRTGYEWIPVEFILCPSLVEEYEKRYGNSGKGYMTYFQMPWRNIQDLKPDQVGKERFLKYHGALNERTYVDEWGVGHESTPSSMHMTKMHHPLNDAEKVEDILQYPMPVYSSLKNPDVALQVQKIQNSGLAAVGNMQMTIWEIAWYIRGMENLMMDMIVDEEMAAAMLDKAFEMSMQRAVLYAEAKADILFLGDDVGMQNSVMMSEDMYLKWIWPRLKELIRKVKSIHPEILVFYHSCGYIEPFIPYLIEAGVDVLNPIQPECMDFETIYRKYGDKLSFHGTIGTQTTMPFGTEQEVKEMVKRNLEIAGPKGGLFVAPTHLLEPEVPWKNIEAYVEACRLYT